MTSSHTLASITADLVTNGIPRHFGAFAEDTSEEAQFPKHLCWFLDESIISQLAPDATPARKGRLRRPQRFKFGLPSA
jgi:hypothetical protein